MKLKRGGLEAVIDPDSGGRLASLKFNGQELLVTEGDGATEWGCYPMVPWAGRVRDGRFTWNDRVHRLPINCGPHALHGTVFDAPWEVSGPQSLRCRLGPTWPWLGEVRSRFTLSDDAFEWRLDVHSEHDAFPVVVGWHPWFRRSVGDGPSVRLDFEPLKMYERDASGIPTGACVPPTSGPWDDCFVDLKKPPRLTWSNGVSVVVESSCDHWVVYDQPAHAVCVEPQSGPPDAFNLGAAAVARPGLPVSHTMRIRVLDAVSSV